MEGINGFVLAGGKSRRMGQDKALMRFEGKPLVLRAAEVLRPFVVKVTLLAPADRYGNLGLPVVADQWPGQGPLAAVCTGLLASTAEWNIFLACDLPLVSPQFIQLLVERVRTHTLRCRGAAHSGWLAAPLRRVSFPLPDGVCAGHSKKGGEASSDYSMKFGWRRLRRKK